MSIKIHGKEYVMVHERISILHDLYPNQASINTEIINDDAESIIMKATITIVTSLEDGVKRSQSFTGHAQEYKNSNQINTTSAYENCETSAIGRACANLGIGIDHSISSAEEVQTAIHQNKQLKIDVNYAPFKKGKNAGTTIGNLDVSSLEWIVNESKMREEIKNVADKELQKRYEEQSLDGEAYNKEKEEEKQSDEIPF